VFEQFEASFVIAGISIRDEAVISTIESIRAQDTLSWECVLFLAEPPHDSELRSVSRLSPRFRVGIGDPLNPWTQLKSELAINVTPGTQLTANALQLILAHTDEDAALLYGDRTDNVRPDWSPIRYRHDNYFGDVWVVPKPTHRRTKCVRIPAALSVGGRDSFAPIPKAVALSTADSARTIAPKTIDVIIPTAGRAAPTASSARPMILELLESIGTHEGVAYTVVLDVGAPPDVRQELLARADVQLIDFDGAFNFSAKCNLGAISSEADVLFFLNDDMICRSPDWPSEVRKALSYKAVAAVGGLLTDNSGLVQCAGHANTPVPHLFGAGLDPSDPGNRGCLGVEREVGGLSGACLAIKRDVFLTVGGFCEDLPHSYNDVDLGFKLIESGHRLLYSPGIVFFHWESASRNPVVSAEETSFLQERWGRHFESDRYTP